MIHTLQRNDDIPTNLFESTPTTKNTVIQGDCIGVMREMPAASVDLIVTDPPYLVNYRSRDGRGDPNDDNDRWFEPAFAQAFRVLRPNRVCVSFYGWPRADRFLTAWRGVGFRPIAHLVFVKRYASATRFVRYLHEQAYVLAKGRPANLREPIGDVLTREYSGNRLHPSQKPVSVFAPLIRASPKEANSFSTRSAARAHRWSRLATSGAPEAYH